MTRPSSTTAATTAIADAVLAPGPSAEPARRCPHPGCIALAERVPEDLPSALAQHSWTCPVHGPADRDRAERDEACHRDLARLRFEAQLARSVAPAEHAARTDLQPLELLQALVDTTAELVTADAVGLMLTGPTGLPSIVVAAGEEQALERAVGELGGRGGPIAECMATARPVTVVDVDRDRRRSPGVGTDAMARFRSVHAAPIRLEEPIVGSLAVLARRPDAFRADERATVAALIDLASIGLLQHRLVGRSDLMALRLQSALEGRVRVERAKGVLSVRHGLSMEDAVAAMLRYAHLRELTLPDVARGVLEQGLDVGASG